LIPRVKEDDLPGFKTWKADVLDAGRKLNIQVDIRPGDVAGVFGKEKLPAIYDVHYLPIDPNEKHFELFETTFREVSLRLLTLGGISQPQAILTIANAMRELRMSKGVKWELYVYLVWQKPIADIGRFTIQASKESIRERTE
jgi:hypothetical protein